MLHRIAAQRAECVCVARQLTGINTMMQEETQDQGRNVAFFFTGRHGKECHFLSERVREGGVCKCKTFLTNPALNI